MSTNDQEAVVTPNNNEVPSTDSTEQPKAEPKKELTLEEKREKAGRLKRALSKLEKELGADEPKEPQSKGKPGEFDYGQKAYLRAEGIKANEIPLVQQAVNDTGKTIEQILEAKWFQEDLKAFREQSATDDALPKGTKRPSQPGRDSVEYWIAKGELPPHDQVELRRKVVNEKTKIATNKRTFTDNPVVS